MTTLLVLPILIPMGAAAVCLIAWRHGAVQRLVGATASAATVGVSIAVLIRVDADGPVRLVMGGWSATVGIGLRADRFGAVMLVVGSTMLLAVLVYALGQRSADERSPWYQPTYLALTAGVSAAFLAGDLFNLFVAVEILLMSSYVLITLEGNDEQIRSGTTYVVLNVVESILLLLGVTLVFAATGTLSFEELPERLAALPPGVKLGLNLLLLLAFGLKAAIFPLFNWLPDSYPAALSPVSAVFAGLLTKVGVYALVRTETLLFPGGQRTLLLVIAGLTMIVGVLGAIAQDDMKRILSFHIVSQIGYMVMGLALGGPAALAATIFFIIHQIPVKTSLFLVEGIVERLTGTSSLSKVSGLARRSFPLAVLFLLPALSLAGLPPFSGFVGKLGVVEAGLDLGDGGIVAVSLVGSLLTLVSMVKIWSGMFWGAVEDPSITGPFDPVADVGVLRRFPLMTSVTTALVIGTVALAVWAGPLYRFAGRAASEMLGVR